MTDTIVNVDQPPPKKKPYVKGYDIKPNDKCPCQSGKKYKKCCYITLMELQPKSETKIGPYDLCPCGSGKKYKWCHYELLKAAK